MKNLQVALMIAIYVVIGLFWRNCVRHWKRAHLPVWPQIGFKRDKWSGRDFVTGLIMAAIGILLIFATERQLGWLTVSSFRPPDMNFFGWVVLIPLLALLEEVLFRGIVLNGLLLLWKKEWLAVLVSALLFGISHSSNTNATPLSVTSTCIGGVIYGIAFVKTRQLWLGYGLHTAWNLVQGPLLGFTVSGFNMHPLIKQNVSGPNLWTGGGYGPEGGLIGIGARCVILLMLVIYLAATRTRTVPAVAESFSAS
jgi:membrane protease YdiL (CAAX protease family)